MSDTKGPMLKGKPSPSLKRMRRMDVDELQQHVRLLQDQAVNHEQRLEKLHEALARTGDKEQQRRIKRLENELERLNLLISEGMRIINQRAQ